MTRCKYCRVDIRTVAYAVDRENEKERVRCFGVYECLDRMLSRERRVVRVFWRVYLNDTDRRTFHRLTGPDGAREFQEEQSAHTYVPALRRVTVRRKVKS